MARDIVRGPWPARAGRGPVDLGWSARGPSLPVDRGGHIAATPRPWQQILEEIETEDAEEEEAEDEAA